LIWLRIPRLCWIRVGIVSILVSFLTLEKMVSVFPIKYNVGYRFVILRYFPSIPSFIRVFIMKEC
jgi:hypothetical protein